MEQSQSLSATEWPEFLFGITLADGWSATKRETTMSAYIEASYDPQKYKDWVGVVAELEAQGIQFDWSSGVPVASPRFACAMDYRNHVFRVLQPKVPL